MPSPIVFATTVRNAEEHVARCVDALRGYANTTPGARHHLYVYESGSTDRTRDAWRSAALSLRGTFARSELVDQTFPADNSTQAWPRCDGKLCPGGNRACRLAAIRQQFKQHIAVRAPDAKVVVLFDGDVELPTAVQFRRALRSELPRYHAVFSLGREGEGSRSPSWPPLNSLQPLSHVTGPRRIASLAPLMTTTQLPPSKRSLHRRVPGGSGVYYDTFASVDEAGHFDGAFLARIRQAKFRTPMAVQSAFGGFGVYRGDVFLSAECSYNRVHGSDLTLSKTDAASVTDNVYGWPCEHAVFHRCLYRKGRRFAISDALRTIRPA